MMVTMATVLIEEKIDEMKSDLHSGWDCIANQVRQNNFLVNYTFLTSYCEEKTGANCNLSINPLTIGDLLGKCRLDLSYF